MSAGTHTPGPWRVGPVDDTIVTDAAGKEVAAIDGDYNSPDEWPRMEANARLIAAAPDLLAALTEIRRLAADIPALERSVRFAEANRKALAAIAKAGGRS